MSAPAYLQAPGLSAMQHVQHGFFGRTGGRSVAALASLNVGTQVGDSAAHVQHNRGQILAALGRSATLWCQTQQVHGAHVVQRDTATAAQTPPADAQVSCSPTLSLAVFTADCVPVLLAAPLGVSSIHAGWRGTAAHVAAHAVAGLHKACGSATSSMRAAIGPAIGPCCFVVGDAVRQQLSEAFAPEVLQLHCTSRGGRSYVDLWALNAAVLRSAGLLADNIEVLRICTHCDPGYFSYRRDAGMTGRQAAVIGLRHTAQIR